MNIKYMELVNELALNAGKNGEVPIAAVIVENEKILGVGINDREMSNHIHGHAEINAINEATEKLKTWKLNDCEIYISTEPCLMCYGAIKQSRIKKIFVGSRQDENKNICFTKYIKDAKSLDYSLVNDMSAKIIKDFFKEKRR